MPEISIGLIIVIILILWAEFVNGWTDAPNAIATIVSTRVMKPGHAVIMAAIFNLLGVLASLWLGAKVAKTIGTGFMDPNMVNLTIIGAAMLGIIIFSTAAWYFGLPTSESHALVAGLTGAAFASGGVAALKSAGWLKVLTGLGFSTFLGFGGGLIVMLLIYFIFRSVAVSKVRRLFGNIQVLSAAFMAYSHGTNDGQKFMGVFTLALVIGGVLPEFKIPLYVILLCASIMAIGTAVGGWRIIKTMGFKLTKLEPVHGFAAETAAATTIEIATHFGIPLSTTHTINMSIMGVGATRRLSAVRWGVTANIVTAWILTFPCCAVISFITTKIVMCFG
ncbi:MAG: inorganic phosphate transporter [Planctomycetota bacterium]|nr:inorganic phosphate transporter [Planctomycetota bacterium]